MKRSRIAVGILIIVIIAAFLVWRFYCREKNDENTLLLSENMEVTEIDVGFKLPGRVIELAVEEGQEVKEGSVLARLVNAELMDAVAQSKAFLQEAMSRAAELKAGTRPQELEQAKAGLKAQEAELARVKKDFERAEILHSNGAIPTSQMDLARSAYEARLEQRRSAVESLSLAKEGARRENIEAAESRVLQARAALRAAEQRLSDTQIHSPTNGIVLKKNVEKGETVAQGVPVYTIGDFSNPWIKVYIKEDKLGLIKLGQVAKVTTDSRKNKTYHGWVSYISSEAEFTPKSVQTQEERVKLVYGVKVRVKNPNQELKPGMPADVRIEVK
jgi:HlyD family secretion protein